MREVTRAENSGFCFGVKQAIEKTEEQVRLNKMGKRIFTCGPLIHNKLVTDDLESKGVFILTDLDEATVKRYKLATLGVYVQSVQNFSPAEKAGIKKADI